MNQEVDSAELTKCCSNMF